MLRRKCDWCGQVALSTVPFDLTQKVLQEEPEVTSESRINLHKPQHTIALTQLFATGMERSNYHLKTKSQITSNAESEYQTHLHIVVLDVVVGDGLQEGLRMIPQSPSVRTQSGLTDGCAPRRATVILVFLFIVVVVNLAGL